MAGEGKTEKEVKGTGLVQGVSSSGQGTRLGWESQGGSRAGSL